MTSLDDRSEPKIRASDHPLFRGISPEWVEEVSRGAMDATYEAGDLLVHEGAVANRLHLIFHGQIAVEVSGFPGSRWPVQMIGPGEVVDWPAIVPPHIWRFDGRVLKETRAISLDATVLRRMMGSHPADGYRFLERVIPVIGRRLENARNQLVAAAHD